MFFILVERVVKMARDAGGDKFAARSTNHTSWTVSGPITKINAAERALLSVLGTHTCLEAKILTKEQLLNMARASSFDIQYDMQKAIREAKKWLLPD